MKNHAAYKKIGGTFAAIILFFGAAYSQCPTSVSVTATESRCRENGTIKVNALPAGAYTYEITGGPSLSSVTTSNTFSSLPAGNYEITVSKGSCSVIINATVPGDYLDPGLLSASSTDVICPGGTACLTMNTPSNGRNPYSYSLVAGPVTRPAQSSPVFCGLPSGDYTIQTLDSCGVVRTTQHSIGVDTGNFDAHFHWWYMKFANCNDIIITPIAAITGTTSPSHQKMKIWYITPGGDTLKANVMQDTSMINADTLVGYANAAGTWKIIAFDECGRQRTSTFDWDRNRWGTLNLSSPAPHCNNYEVSIWNSWQGNLPVGYIIRKCSDNSIVYETHVTPPASDYSPSYVLQYDTCYTAESFNSCGDTIRRTDSYSRNPFKINARPLPNCDSKTTGHIWFWVDKYSSNLPVVYTIIGGPSGIGKTKTIDETEWFSHFLNLPFGTYTIAAVDACGLKDTIQVALNAKMDRTVTITQTPHCSGGANVHLKVVTSTTGSYESDAGGTELSSVNPSYTPVNAYFVRPYNDTPGIYEADFLNVKENSLTFKLNDWNGCELDTTIAIKLYTPPTLNNITGFVCNANSTGTINYNTLGGIAPFRYRIRPDSTGIWSPWQNNAIFSGISPGSYDVNVEDACPNGSIRSLTFYTWEKSDIDFTAPCATTGQSITLSADNKVFGVNYQWYLNGLLVGTGDSYTIPNFSTTNEGQYKLRQTFQGGVCVDSVSRWLLKCSILPLTFGELTGQAKNKKARLQWNTFKDAGDIKFVIERSTDGTAFAPIGTVNSLGNPGGSTYEFVDKVMPVIAFYRVKYSGIDSKIFHSNTVRLSEKDLVTNGIIISPVPFKNWVLIQMKADKKGTSSIKFFNMAGAQVLKKTVSVNAGNNVFWIDDELSGMPPGTYIIEVSGDGFTQRNKVIKQ